MGVPNLSNARTDLYKCREDPDNYGVLLAGASMRLLNLATESIQGKPEIKRSEESTSDLLPGEMKRVGTKSDGSITCDLRLGPQLDEFIEEGLGDTFSTALAISSNAISFAAVDNSFSGAPLSAVVVNTWIKIGGTGGVAGNRGDAYVLSKPTSTKCILMGLAIADESASATVTVTGQYVRNGVKSLSSTYERKHTDRTTTPFQAIPGCLTNGLQMSFSARELIKVTVNVVGLFPLDESASTVGLSAATAADVGESMDMSTNMRAFRQNGVLSGNIKMFDFNLQNNFEEVPIGQQTDPDGYSPSVKALTGNIEGFLRDGEARRALMYNFSEMDFHFAKKPAAGGTYYFSFFRCKSTNAGDVPKESRTGPGMLKCSWEAMRHANGFWMQVCKLP